MTITPETTAEHDARTLVAHEHDVTPGEIAIGVIIGRTSEFFDFFVYAIASVLVFPRVFFSYADPLTGTLHSFAIFALAFVARPVGSIFFMGVDRRYGRGVKLTIALFLLGGSTAAIAFLPGFERIGWWAVALLALFRMGQGVALGGSWDGMAPLLAMNAPERHRGWYAALPQLGAPIGLIVASLLFAYFTAILPAEDFLSWGWRYPFFVAFAINVVALFARLRMVVTPEYTKLYENLTLAPASVAQTLRTAWRTVLLGAFAPLVSFAMFHIVTVFPLSWVHLFTDQTPSRFLLVEAGAAVLGLLAIIASGMLADRLGRRTVLGGCAALIAAFSGFAPQLLDAGRAGETAYMVVGFILLGLCFGQASGSLSTNFAPRHRYTGSALTADLAWMFGAGFAPLVALFLASHFGLVSSGAYLLSGALVTLLVLGMNREMARRLE